jgi:hypothetical protein
MATQGSAARNADGTKSKVTKLIIIQQCIKCKAVVVMLVRLLLLSSYTVPVQYVVNMHSPSQCFTSVSLSVQPKALLRVRSIIIIR